MTRNLTSVTGNRAAAIGAKLARPDVVAAYPITPQTPLVEHLSSFISDGELDASYRASEGEHGVLSFLQGAALTGSRTFTGSSSHGLFWMFESYIRQAHFRLPMVMCVVGRESGDVTVWSGFQDVFNIKEAGWIQIICENNQEIVDSVIRGYKVGEHEDVMLPVNVCYDGFYLSHFSQGVEIPDQEMVDQFLPRFDGADLMIDPDDPMSVSPLTPGDLMTEYRIDHAEAMKTAKDVIEDIDEEYEATFGRSYGGLVEPYRLDGADVALVTYGSPTGTAREAVDQARAEGERVGLLKVRVTRPFPAERILDELSDVAAVGVIDKAVNFGHGTGQLYQDIRATFSGHDGIPVKSYIGGLGGSDITVEKVRSVIDDVDTLDAGSTVTTEWLDAP
jgi:phenylglyoxylate dehydrogenase alpha subunit